MSGVESDEEFAFTWRIENVSSCDQTNSTEIVSPTFTAENLGGSKWFLSLYPRGEVEESDGFLSLFLNNIDLTGKSIKLDFKCDVIGKNNEILKSSSAKNYEFQKFDTDGWEKVLEFEKINNQMRSIPGDILTILCFMKSTQKKNKLATGCEGRTKIGVDRLSFHWNVRYPESSSWSESKKFSFPEGEGYAIEIILTCPNDNILISIRRIQAAIPLSYTPTCYVKISLLDVVGVERHTKIASYLFKPLGNSTWEFPTFITKTELKNKGIYLKNEIFDLTCELSISNGKQLKEIDNYKYSSSPIANRSGSVESITSFQNDFRNLFNNGKHSDIKLKAGDKIFPVHKSVLVARSPVFSAMFEQDMLESQTGIIDIQDTDAETLKIFLNFVYTDIIAEVDKEIALKLLIAADKYQVLSLREKCSAFLMTILSDKNVCEILAIAEMVGQKCLKSFAIDYIKTHSEDILTTPEWCEWVEKNFKLGVEVVCKLSAELGSGRK